MRGEAGRRYRFGVFEADAATGELWRKGVRVRVHAQPFQVLLLMLERPGEVLTREEISRALWPEGTFVDYEHGVNSAVNRLREALGDKAASPRYVETLARRGYRFLGAVELVGVAGVGVAGGSEGKLLTPVLEEGGVSARGEETPTLAGGEVAGEDGAPGVRGDGAPGVWEEGAPGLGGEAGGLGRFLARPEDLPRSSHATVRTLFLLLQGMYLGFYVGALANLPEAHELLSAVYGTEAVFVGLIATAALLIPVRVFLVCAALFRAPGFRERFLRVWWGLVVMDLVWALSPFLLLHHMDFGLALACVTVLVYAPFAQRSLVLMGAGGVR